MKTVPEVYGKYLTKGIGQTHEYTKNRDKGSFSINVDLKIPINPDVEDFDISAALDDEDTAISTSNMVVNTRMVLQPKRGKKHVEEEKTYQPYKDARSEFGGLMKGSDFATDIYMPIKALN